MLHDEADSISTLATTKTFVNFFRWRNGKGWCLFVMKRAESQVIRPSFLELNEFTYHVENIYAAKDLLYSILGNHGDAI